MNRRFFLEAPIEVGRTYALDGGESHHLSRVLRAQVGETVIVFDGGGSEFLAEIDSIRRKEVLLRVVQEDRRDREPCRSVDLYVALPKGERQRWLVEKAVEMGASSLTPLITTRGVAQPVGSARSRLERVVIEASKQCGRNRLMQIRPPRTIADLLEDASTDASTLKWWLHPGGESLQDSDRQAPVWVAVGPEGGFTDDETSMAADCGWQIVGLGPRILRIETAAITLLAKAIDA